MRSQQIQPPRREPEPEPEPVVSTLARRSAQLTPEVVRFLQGSAGNQQVVARLQASGSSLDRATIVSVQAVVGVTADGVFGPMTRSAVIRWQAANGLAADGVAGPLTLAAMGLSGASAPAEPAPAAPAPAPAEPVPETPVASPWESGAGGGELDALMAEERLSPDEMDTARNLIAALPDEAQRADLFLQLQSKVTYHSQRDNQSTEGGKLIGDVMCNLTSLAMCLEYLGVDNPYPEMQFEDALEKIRVEKVGEPRTTSAGWGGVATYLGVKWGFVTGAGANDQRWYEANVQPHLAAGEAMMLSIDGHICRLQGLTSEGLVADDPYGESTLGAGSERGWDGANTKDAGSSVGEDLVWKWADVERHKMLWIAWFQGTAQ
jgi:peptidoglycan hydrolase-like protein with peptidoglycan-binding domain